MGDAYSCLNCFGAEDPPPRTRPKIDKSLIGTPQNFQHTGHIGSTDFGSADLTTVHNQMHSKGGYDHSSHVPAEATPLGHNISIRVGESGGGHAN
ncbi:CDC42 small effector protein 2-A-like [Dysidea avara]|uniref:CDC42 small effector protein 2-A-like n=1 Tax=Dysidea avara TaxID=196820 RepID=UPI00332214C3